MFLKTYTKIPQCVLMTPNKILDADHCSFLSYRHSKMTRKTFSFFYLYNSVFEGLYLSSQWICLPDILRVNSWLGMFCEYHLISHAYAFSIRPHPLKVVTLFAHSTYFHFSCSCLCFNCYRFSILDTQ